jgi:hypothetical protein
MENKHSLCPLCGGEPQRFESLFTSKLYSFGCPKCGFTTFWGAGLEWDAWEVLVSKFQPISRIRVGDTLMDKSGLTITVSWVSPYKDFFNEVDRGRILDSADVGLWPWEFEEEGGEQ